MADELAADIVRDQQMAEQERRIYHLEAEIRELQLWRIGIYHTSRPAPLAVNIVYNPPVNTDDPE